MRTLFLVLLCANLAFYAWSAHIADREPGTDAAPFTRQIEPQRVPLVGTGRAAAPKASAATSAPASAQAPARSDDVAAAPAADVPAREPDAPAPAEAPAVASAAPTPPEPRGVCVEWGSFTLADAPAAEKVLASLDPALRWTQNRVQESAGWWVYIAPQGDRPGALKKTAELRGLGFTPNEYFIVPDDGKWRYAVSLGVFRSEDAARNHLERLKSRGVRTAQVGPRDTQVPKVWLQMKDVNRTLEARLRDIASRIPGSELRKCE